MADRLPEDFRDFLAELALNNDRDWFNANKKRFEKSVKEPFRALVEDVLERCRAWQPDLAGITPEDCIYRIYRDTRFSKDKTPYKTYLAARIGPNGRKAEIQPGYYFHVGFDQIYVAGGAYFLDPDSLRKVRQAVWDRRAEFEALVSEAGFRSTFEKLLGERNKVMPAEFREAAKEMPDLTNKQFYFAADLPPDAASEPDFAGRIVTTMQAGWPMVQFLRSALA